MEFVIAAQDGFTADLHRWAVTHPGITLKASVDGAYGSTPNIANFDKTIMVGGGCGASFVFGMALDALKRIPEDRNEAILLIWIVRNASKYRENLRID
jgi:predicted ferric reductase